MYRERVERQYKTVNPNDSTQRHRSCATQSRKNATLRARSFTRLMPLPAAKAKNWRATAASLPLCPSVRSQVQRVIDVCVRV
jgi:hypothetical protein